MPTNKFYLLLLIFNLLANIGWTQSGKALLLNGCDNCLEVRNSGSTLQNINSITVEAWVMPNCDDDNRIIIGKEWCQGQFSFYLSLNAGKLFWNTSANGFCTTFNIYESNSIIAPVGEFTHVAVVHDQTSVTMYVNGTQVSGNWISGGHNSIQSSSEPFRIGCYRNISGSFGNYFSGLLDNVRVWETALTQNQILSSMTASLTGNESDLLLNFDMESTQIGPALSINNLVSANSNLNSVPFISNFHSPYCISYDDYFKIKPYLGEDKSYCDNINLTLTHDIVNYKMIRWQNGSTTNDFYTDKQGVFHVNIETELCRFIGDTIEITGGKPDTTKLNYTVCPGDSIVVNNQTYVTPGSYIQQLLTPQGCDSIIQVNIDIHSITVPQIINFSLCDEQVFVFQGNVYDSPGTYVQTITDPNGCNIQQEINITECNYHCIQQDTALCYLQEPFPSEEFGISKIWESVPKTVVYQSPLLADMDNDCIPEIVAASDFGYVSSPRITTGLSILNSTNGQLKNFISTVYYPWGGPTPFAIADINNDGVPEIVIAAANTSHNTSDVRRRLVCYSYDGTILWISDKTYGDFAGGDQYGGTPGFADFNQDGIPEVYIYNEIFNATNGVKLAEGGFNGVGSVSAFFNNFIYSTTIAVNMDDNDSDLELVAGYSIYKVEIENVNDMTGNTMTPFNIRVNNQLKDGYTSVADINLDGKLDAVISSPGSNTTSSLYVYTYRNGQTELLAATTLPTTGSGCCPNQVGPAFVGDVDGTGRPAIGVTRPYNLITFEYDNTLILKQKWRLQTNDESGSTGMTMFDFNQDGRQEIIYRDETHLRIMDGSVNPPVSIATFPCVSGTGAEFPIVGDIDFTGESKICVPCGQNSTTTGKIHVFGSPQHLPGWAPSRGIWNQYNYHVFNISDALTVPVIQQNNALLANGKFNNFLVQASLLDSTGTFLQSVPNLAGLIECVSYDNYKDEYTIKYSIENNISASASFSGKLKISFFNKHPIFNEIIDTLEIQTFLLPGDRLLNQSYIFNGNKIDTLYMLIHAQNVPGAGYQFITPECNYEDNLVSFHEVYEIITVEEFICEGDSMLFAGSYYTEEGEFLVAQSNVTDCDSISRLVLGVYPTYEMNKEFEICAGESVVIDQISYFRDTTFVSNRTTLNGCDSTIRYDIIVHPPVYTYKNLSLCKGDSVLVNGVWYFNNAGAMDTIATEPCPTYESIAIVFNDSYYKQTSITLCPGEELLAHGQSFTETGVFDVTFQTIFGCDSIFSLEVEVLPYPEPPVFEADCKSNIYTATVENPLIYNIEWSNGSESQQTEFTDDQTISITYTYPEFGCEIRADYDLAEIPRTAPEVLLRDTIIYPGKPLQFSFNLPENLWNVLWSPSRLFSCDTCFGQTIITREDVDILIYLEHISGCSYNFDFSIEVDPEQDILIPNIFAPDAPGINKEWEWFIPECFMVNDLKVYDRWGNLVYQLINPTTVTWDGTFNGKIVEDGVYTYLCLYMLPDGSMGKKYGDVTVIHTR